MATKRLEPTTEVLKDTFHLGYEMYEGSRIEADEIWNMYHNRQWTRDQAAILENRGQPKETFNVIKLFARTLVGYYSTVVNQAKALPRQFNDITMATLGTDLITATMEQNNFDVEGDKLKLSAIVSGIMCAEVTPVYSGERDRFGRPQYNIRLANVPDYEIVLDPMSYMEDYSDGRFLHRFKWAPTETMIKLFGEDSIKGLEEYYNHLEIPEAEFEYRHNTIYHGKYRVFNNYLLVHSVLEDYTGKRWSVYWCGDKILRKKEITYKGVKWDYRVVKTHTSDKCEFYGLFREIAETQKAINQAIVKLQLMANSQKVFVEKSAVENIESFTTAVNRVTGVIPIKSLQGIKVENLSREALELYQIIDRALDRIQRVLGVNDSFLGMAYASDSGRKVKLQQNATMMSLRYLTSRIESMYRFIGEDILALSNQYYQAEQVLRVSDEVTGFRFIHLNKPMQAFSGQMDATGNPIMQPMFEQVYDPENQKPLEDEKGNLVFAPIPEEESEVRFDKLDVKVESSAYNDEDERSQLLLESVMSGNIGSMLAKVNPAGFFKAADFGLRSMKTKYSPEIAKILAETAQMLGGNPEAEREAQFIGQESGRMQTPKAKATKLPTNTNEEA